MSFFEAVGVARLTTGSLVKLIGSESHQDLVVSKVVVLVQVEVLMSVLFLQAQSDLTFENNVQLREHLTLLHNALVLNKYSAVQSHDEVRNKFVASGKVSMLEQAVVVPLELRV